MLVSASDKPTIDPKKLVTDMRMQTATDHDILITRAPISFSRIIAHKEAPVKIQNKLSSPGIFSITFSYLGEVYHTKVLKVTYSGNQSLYKVAISSSIASHTSICWLQYQVQGWDMLLGQELDEGLKRAITLAIGCQEF